MSKISKKKLIVFSIVAVFLFLLLIEVGSRIVFLIHRGSTHYLTYGFHSLFQKDQTFNDIEEDGKNDKREIFRVACFGGSTTKGTFARHGYPYYLQQYLQKEFPNKKIIVENFGVNAGSHVEASYFARSAIDMDFSPNFSEFSKKKRDRLLGPERKYKIPNLVFLYSHVNASFTETLRLKSILTDEETRKFKRIKPEIALRGESWFSKLFIKIDHFFKYKSFFYYAMSRLIYWMKHDMFFVVHDELLRGGFIKKTIHKIQKQVSKTQRYIKVSNVTGSGVPVPKTLRIVQRFRHRHLAISDLPPFLKQI